MRETSIKLILSLDDLYNAISNCVNESLATAIVSYLAQRINDEGYIRRAGFNLLLYQHNKFVQRKLHEFMEILGILSSSSIKNYALIKAKPFITNIWNDIDIFSTTKDVVTQILSLLKIQSKVKEIVGKESKGITVYLKNSTLAIDIYTLVGWRGLKYVELPDNKFEEACIQGGNIHLCSVGTLPLCSDLLIQILHLMANSKTISLSDVIKFLCTLRYCRDYLDSQILQGAKVFLSIEYLIRRITHLILLKERKILEDGVITIPPEPWVKTQLMLNNLKLRNRNVMGYYYETKDMLMWILVHKRC